jgi:hypothetical protein
MEAAAEASLVADLFLRLERGGQMLPIDPSVMPTMYHSATISAGEVETLRRIKNVVRFGRVKRIERGAVVLEGGEVEGPQRIFMSIAPPARWGGVPRGRSSRTAELRFRPCVRLYSA